MDKKSFSSSGIDSEPKAVKSSRLRRNLGNVSAALIAGLLPVTVSACSTETVRAADSGVTEYLQEQDSRTRNEILTDAITDEILTGVESGEVVVASGTIQQNENPSVALARANFGIAADNEASQQIAFAISSDILLGEDGVAQPGERFVIWKDTVLGEDLILAGPNDPLIP